MKERNYADLALILALVAFAISIFFFSLQLLRLFEIISPKIIEILQNRVCLGVWGWMLGLVLAFVSFKMGQRMKGSFLLINITRITSVLAIIAALFWGTLIILNILIGPYVPHW